jgi:hypothetical protein
MSVCVDYFFNHGYELSAVAKEINGWIGCSLSPFEGNREDLFSRFLGMELTLSKHSLENDRDLNFQDFTYRLGVRSPIPEADLRPMQIPAMAFIAYALFRRMGIVGLLVYDVQSLLARYEARVTDGLDELFDLVSNRVVRFPDHLETLVRNLPDYGRVSSPEA